MLKRWVLIALFFTATLAAAGDGIKWTKSKELKFAEPGTPITEYPKDLIDIRDKYYLEWVPYTNKDIDMVQANFEAWDVFAVGMNSELRAEAITTIKAAEKTVSRRDLQKRYLTFVITITANTEDFAGRATKDFWNFRLLTDDGALEPREVVVTRGLSTDDYQKYLKTSGTNTLINIGDYKPRLEIFFENPYEGKNPGNLKLIVEGGDVKHGFEWRFKQP